MLFNEEGGFFFNFILSTTQLENTLKGKSCVFLVYALLQARHEGPLASCVPLLRGLNYLCVIQAAKRLRLCLPLSSLCCQQLSPNVYF